MATQEASDLSQLDPDRFVDLDVLGNGGVFGELKPERVPVVTTAA